MTTIAKRKPAKAAPPKKEQLLHLVFGGELTGVESIEFKDLSKLHIVGMFPDYESAHMAWQAFARQTIDNAHMRYFIVHLHRLLDPDAKPKRKPR
jgi:hypothetical protein